MNKEKILFVLEVYLPGYRGGGPTQSIKNLTDILKNVFEINIFTLSNDFKNKKVYPDVQENNWNDVNQKNIYYSSNRKKYENLKQIMKKSDYDFLWFNSFFSTLTIFGLIIRKIYNIKKPVIIMPRGELMEQALNIKKNKKNLYIGVMKLLKLDKNVQYYATSQEEVKSIKNILNMAEVELVSNLPNSQKKIVLNTKKEGTLNIVMLSRIVPIKNIHYALNVILMSGINITLDLYGIIEDSEYWRECQKIISKMPSNITVNYKKKLENHEVIETLANYDLFFFPTLSENYGHVISEALQASVPLLIANTTPWRALEKQGFGWDIDLDRPEVFVEKLNEVASLSTEEHNEIKTHIYNKFDINKKISEASSEYINLIKNIY